MSELSGLVPAWLQTAWTGAPPGLMSLLHQKYWLLKLYNHTLDYFSGQGGANSTTGTKVSGLEPFFPDWKVERYAIGSIQKPSCIYIYENIHNYMTHECLYEY